MILNSTGARIAQSFDESIRKHEEVALALDLKSESEVGESGEVGEVDESGGGSKVKADVVGVKGQEGSKLVDTKCKVSNQVVGGLDIVLPNTFTCNTHVAIDIGGTLVKVVYYTSNSASGSGGRLNFAKYQTEELAECIQLLTSLIGPGASTSSSEPPPPLAATGGGAHKFFSVISEAIAPRKVVIIDEISSLISGVDYFISQVPDEIFHYQLGANLSSSNLQFVPTPEETSKYPYLLVNIGSGVSIIKVTGKRQFERVSGTSLGGGTFWGLASLLTGLESFDEILALSQRGQNKNVDMLVGDIYGQDYQKIGLKATAIASSMGKVYRKDLCPPETAEAGFRPEDICASLLYTVSNNIGQIAYLNACKHNVNHIYFGGYFIRGHPVTMHTLQYAINFWSGGKINAKFLRHEGYLGAMGSLLDLNSNP